VEQAQAQLQASLSQRKQVEVLAHKLAALQGERQEAEAKLQAAQLNLSYCTIPAPIAGYLAQKNVQVGDRVQTGQPLMAVVPLREVYVEANLKETQLKNVRLGQPVTIKADVYPAYTYYGKVDGIRAGTGASFSLLPPENATGNWIKVVQRVPVKISLDEPPPAEYPLRIGFSLQVTISTRNRSGGVLVPLASKPQ
jgi:membrane fusion protein (multidrug efflux system)